MSRKIIHIDEEKCIGCGACASACHQGAIGLVNGKARLLREDYCDGLGMCLPVCPTNAISFIEQDALPAKDGKDKPVKTENITPCACPGSRAHALKPATVTSDLPLSIGSALKQWPVQIQLAPVQAAYFDNARLLIAADCAAYAYGDFHRRFMKNHITLIGCPKLDPCDYSKKLSEILRNNNIRSLTVVRMQVPCCGGLERAATTALKESGKFLPWQVVTLTTDGQILE